MYVTYIGVPNLKLMEIFNSCTNKTNIFVTWDAATSPYCGGVLYYIVMISSDEHSNIMNDIVNVTLPLTATFSNLRNDTTYDVTVTAYNRVGAGMTTTESLRILLPEPTQRRSNNTGSYVRTVCMYILYITIGLRMYIAAAICMYVRTHIYFIVQIKVFAQEKCRQIKLKDTVEMIKNGWIQPYLCINTYVHM